VSKKTLVSARVGLFQGHNVDFPIKLTAVAIRRIPRSCLPLRQGVAKIWCQSRRNRACLDFELRLNERRTPAEIARIDKDVTLFAGGSLLESKLCGPKSRMPFRVTFAPWLSMIVAAEPDSLSSVADRLWNVTARSAHRRADRNLCEAGLGKARLIWRIFRITEQR
jgi:hypothetical protein